MEKFIVQESAAKMPSSCWGRYRRFGILRLARGPEFDGLSAELLMSGRTATTEALMITDRHHLVEEVVRTWERCNDGTTERCAAAIARNEAVEICIALNILYKRSSRPSMRKVAAFVRKFGADSLPTQELARYRRAERYVGSVRSVLALHGYAGLARAVVVGSPLAIALRRRLNDRQLAMLDHALHTTERAA